MQETRFLSRIPKREIASLNLLTGLLGMGTLRVEAVQGHFANGVADVDPGLREIDGIYLEVSES